MHATILILLIVYSNKAGMCNWVLSVTTALAWIHRYVLKLCKMMLLPTSYWTYMYVFFMPIIYSRFMILILKYPLNNNDPFL